MVKPLEAGSGHENNVFKAAKQHVEQLLATDDTANSGTQVSVDDGTFWDPVFRKWYVDMCAQYRGCAPVPQNVRFVKQFQKGLLNSGLVDFFFSHGGQNSVSDALTAQVPVLLFPKSPSDTFDAIGAFLNDQHLGYYSPSIVLARSSPERIEGVLQIMVQNQDTYKRGLGDFAKQVQSEDARNVANVLVGVVDKWRKFSDGTYLQCPEPEVGLVGGAVRVGMCVCPVGPEPPEQCRSPASR